MNANDLFLWTDDLSVSTQEVDEQHKELFGLINQLHLSLRENHGKETTTDIVDRLAEKTQSHFLFEESLMRLTQYAEYARHKEQHESLMEQIRELQDKLANDDATMTVELMHFHKSWWGEHIRNSDRQFSIHYEQSELAPDRKTGQEKQWWRKFW